MSAIPVQVVSGLLAVLLLGGFIAASTSRAQSPRLPCPALTTATTATTITTPSDGSVVSTTVALAVSTPNITLSQVAVCAITGTRVSVVALLNSPDWSGTWDVSGVPSQHNVVLQFIAQYPDGALATIGQRLLTIDHMTPHAVSAVVGPDQTNDNSVLTVSAHTPIVLSAGEPPLDDGGTVPITLTYGLDGEPLQVASAPLTLTLGASGDGPHTLLYGAIDAAGNGEALQTLTLTLDATPPTVKPLLSGPLGPDGSASGPLSVMLEVRDTGSGLASVSYTLQSGFPLPYAPGQSIAIDSSTVLNYAATDRVGNITLGSLPLTITTATPLATPTASATAPPGATPTPWSTPSKTPVPSSTTTPTKTATVTPVPSPTATWAPLDGPLPLQRATPIIDPVAGSGVLHRHTMPRPTPVPRRVSLAHRRRTVQRRPARATSSHRSHPSRRAIHRRSPSLSHRQHPEYRIVAYATG